MSARSLGTLTLDLVAKIGGFTGPLDKASRHSKKTADDMAKYGKAIGTAIGIGATVAATALVMVVSRQRDLIDQQAKSAQQLRTTYESLSNLGRAGELAGIGMAQINTASRQLDVNLGKAIQGIAAQADAFERLGLNAQEVADLPLDQRISKINQALRDNVKDTERAAVAADIFGTRNAAAIQALDPDTIAEAARQVEIFGLNLSDVDAAKVEMANDAMSTFGLLTDGIGKQLTVELAPILKAVGDEFLRSAEAAGGLGTVVEDSVGKAITAVSFLADAADGVKRVFLVVADAIIVKFNLIAQGVADSFAFILRGISKVPGIDFTDTVASLEQFSKTASGVVSEAAQNIQDTLMAPLAGDSLRAAYQAAQAAGQAAAEAAVANREIAKTTGEAFSEVDESAKKSADSINKQISAIERAAKTWGMSADEVKIYDLTIQGATQSQIDYARSLLDTISALDEQKKAQEDAAKRMESLLQSTIEAVDPTAKLVRELMALDELMSSEAGDKYGDVVLERMLQINEEIDEIVNKTEESTEKMSVFAEQAARNMQDAFADFLFDPFADGVDGMEQAFADAIRRMVANAASAKFFEGVSGITSDLFGFKVPGFASGTNFAPGGLAIVGEQGPELVHLPRGSRVTPNNALGTTNNALGTTVNVINNTSARASVRRSNDASGREIVDIVIGEVAASIASGGTVGQAMQSTYGLSRRGVIRT